MGEIFEAAFEPLWGGPSTAIFVPVYEREPVAEPMRPGPIDWRPRPRPVALDTLPTSLDRYDVYPVDSDFGLNRSTIASLRSLLGAVSSPRALLVTGRLASALRYASDDQAAQLALYGELFGHVPGMRQVEQFLAADPRRLLISERHLVALQRLIVEHALADAGRLDAPVSRDEADRIRRAILGVSSVLRDADDRLVRRSAMDEDAWLAFAVRYATYFDLPDWMRTSSRWFALLATRARERPRSVSIDELLWGSGAPIEHAIANAYICARQAGLLDELVPAAGRPLISTTIADGSVMQDRLGGFLIPSAFPQGIAMWTKRTPRGLAWDRSEIMRTPFATAWDSNIALSPRGALGRLAGGLHEQAEAGCPHYEARRAFEALLEQLMVERTAELVETSVRGATVTARDGGVRVDVDGATIAIEVVARQLPWAALATATLGELHEELAESIYARAVALGSCVRDLAREAPEREIWPIIALAGIPHLVPLADRLQRDFGASAQSNEIQPLTLFDLDDLDLLCGLVETGEPLTPLLREKTLADNANLELTRFISERRPQASTTPAALVRAEAKLFCDTVNGDVLPRSRAPRSLRGADAIADKLSQLRRQHITPLSDYVERLRQARGANDIPWFDPRDGASTASILLLFEAPEPDIDPAHGGSGFVSVDNDTETAAATWALLRDAKVPRGRIAVWNAIPWYRDAAAPPTEDDIRSAQPLLQHLIYRLHYVSAVVFFGEPARAAWRLDISRADLITCPHPTDPAASARESIREAFHEALTTKTNPSYMRR